VSFRGWLGLGEKGASARGGDQSLIGIADALNQSPDLETMAQRLVDLMVDALSSSAGVLFLLDKSTGELAPFTVSSRPLVRAALQHLPIPFRSHRYPVEKPINEVGRCAKEVRMKQGAVLADFLAPGPSAEICNVMQSIVGAKSFVALPVVVRTKVVGVTLLTFLQKTLSDAQLQRLRAFNQLVATALVTSRDDLAAGPHLTRRQPDEPLRDLEDTFLGLVAHELGSPLVGMGMMLSILREDSDFLDKLSADQRRAFTNVLEESERLRSTVTNIESALELARSDRPEPLRVAIHPLVERVVRAVEMEILDPSMQIDLRLDDAPDLEQLYIKGDPTQLEHVVWELLNNAIKHGGAGTEVQVSARKRVIAGLHWYEIAVEDNGPGVPERIVQHLFHTRFNFGDPPERKSTPGFGLGLFVVKRIVDNHNATIQFESAAGRGTCVLVQFPIDEPGRSFREDAHTDA
jgi:signal transduction histidine kinase